MTVNPMPSSLQYHPGNRRVIREASRLLATWYSANYWLDPTDRNYLKTGVENLFEIAFLRQSASPRLAKTNGNPTKRIVRILTTKSAAGGHLTYGREQLNSRKDSNFYRTNHPGFTPSVRHPPPLAKTNGKPTKRTLCTLATESVGGNRLTYEKELLNSGDDRYFYKTNDLGLPHGLLPYDPDNSILCIYARNDIMVQFPLLLFAN